MKIALAPMGDERWMAGEVIVRNILRTVAEIQPPDLRLSLVSVGDVDDAQLRERYPDAFEYLVWPTPRRFSREWAARKISARLLSTDSVAAAFLKRHEVNVLFGSCLLARYPTVATLSWIPDFQHIHLPHLFSAQERADRDATFRRTAELSTRVVLLSHAVKADFDRLLPSHAAKGRVLSPISRIPPHIYGSDPGEVVKEYNLPPKFFYLPNQFWQHKNQELVFSALRNLKQRGVEVNVVCSGFPGDHRSLRHFASLWENVSRWNIRDQIIYLGLIPHDDVLRLMRQTICVLNPSQFEGWGISVDEARSVGKRVLASALPSHREQQAPGAIYFDPRNVDELEQRMKEIWVDAVPGPDRVLEEAARVALPQRLRNYGEQFIAISREARKGGAQ
jgi:glycosyltransferase involved in cell wall biosynthesis